MQKNLTPLLSQINSIIKVYEKHTLLSGENFNVFSIMGMESDEVRTHSAIIGELLNPKGSHSLGSKPLELFIDQTLRTDDNYLIDYDTSICEKEVHIGAINEDKTEGGRIDLIITDNTGVKFLIENKIFAPEQRHQLGRYKNKYPNAKILYLTLEGKDSREEIEFDYERISYEYHILKWIEACAKEAYDKPMIREVLNQYAFLIRKLTNQTTNVEMKEEIQKIIKENYLESLEVYKNFTDVRNTFVKEAFSKIKEQKFLSDKWHIEFDTSNIWSANTSQTLLFYDYSHSKNFFYLRYEYSSGKLFLGIVPRELKKSGKRSIQREEVRLSGGDFVITYLNESEKLISEIIKRIQLYIQENIAIYNS
jgi:hypothetical protein